MVWKVGVVETTQIRQLIKKSIHNRARCIKAPRRTSCIAMMECDPVSVDVDTTPVGIGGSDMDRAGCMIGDRFDENVEGEVDHVRRMET